MEVDQKQGHFKKLSIDAISETVDAKPGVACNDEEVHKVLKDLSDAVEDESYIPPTPTKENPSLSDTYIFDKLDEKLILKDLDLSNFVSKVKDVGKGAKKRKSNGLSQEFLYVFRYACKLIRRDAEGDGVNGENVLIYIKINDRKDPNQVVFIVSFHKNNPKV